MSPTSDTSGAAGRIRRALPLLLVAAVAIGAYVGTLGHALVYDDSVIAQNELMHHPWNLRGIFASSYYGSLRHDSELYRPLAVWSLALNFGLNRLFQLAGAHPAGFHAFNVLLHAAASVLVFAVVRSLRRASGIPVLALAAALLFAAHPIHSEAVANVTNRSEMLAAILGLSFLVLHRRGRYVPAGVCAFLALCGKESAVGFLPLAWVTDRLFARGVPEAGETGERPPAPWKGYVAAGAALVVFLALRSSALAGSADRPALMENPLIAAPIVTRLLTAAALQFEYLRLVLVPIGLSSDYSFDQMPLATSVADARVVAFAVVLVAAGWAAWIARKRFPEVAWSVAGYALLFATTSNALFPIGVIFGERLAYAPSIFVCVLAAFALARLAEWSRPPVALSVLAIVCATLVVLTVRRSAVWKDDMTLFRDQVATAPRSAKAHLSLGTTLALAGREAEAVPEYETSLRIYPEHSQTWYCLGNALHRLHGDPSRIVAAYESALRFGPMNHEARINLLLTLLELGRKEEAKAQFAELVRLAPGHPAVPALAKRIESSR